MKTRRHRKTRGGANISVETFQDVVGAALDSVKKSQNDGKKKILSAFAKLSPEDKKHVEVEFMPINEQLDLSKHAELGKKLYDFASMT